MDGNSRWSKKNSISKYIAYKKGANNLIKLSDYIFNNTKCKYISAFALSVNNLERSSTIINIIKKVLIDSLNHKKVKELNFDIHFIGNLNFLDLEIKKKIDQFNLHNNYTNKLFIFLNYGGREDIENAALNLKSKKEKLTSYLSTINLPDPDLLIRTGGFSRLSNFLLYQIAFTELYFLKKLWPDLNKSDLKKIFFNYSKIERKFGR